VYTDCRLLGNEPVNGIPTLAINTARRSRVYPPLPAASESVRAMGWCTSSRSNRAESQPGLS
jgi:hypothetical protein